MKTLKIAIADDHPVILKGLVEMIKDDSLFQLVFVANDPEELWNNLRSTEIDILILDVVMPQVSSTNLFREIIGQFPELNIVAYTSLNSPILVKMLFRDGVRAYVCKNDPLEQLVDALKTVAMGLLYVPEAYKQHVERRDTEEWLDISDRELQVLKLIAEQYTTSRIAETLFISVNTVESHRKKLLEKFQVSNLAGLILEAIKRGYIH
jgi:DNA-binding NarL/FixJ family response regulator